MKTIAICLFILIIVILFSDNNYEHMDTLGSDNRMVVSDTSGNLDSIDAYKTVIPRGAIIMWSGALTAIPRGWKLCDGLGNTPANDGVVATGITIPDLRGRFIIGVNPTATRTESKDATGTKLSSYEMNSDGGEERHKLTVNELPNHQHTVDNYGSWSGVTWATAARMMGTVNTDPAPKINTGSISGIGPFDGAHNNIPPYYTLAYIIKVV